MSTRSCSRRSSCGRWSELQERLQNLARQIDEATDSEALQTAELTREEAELAAARETLDGIAGLLADRHQRSADLAARIEGRQEFVRGARQTTQEIAERLETGKTVAAQRQDEIETHRQSLAALESRSQQLFGERDEALTAVEEDERLISAAEQALQEVVSRLEEVRNRMMASLGQSNELQNKLHHEQIEREKAAYRRERAEQELVEARDDLSRINHELQEADSGLGEMRATFEERSAARDAAAQRISENQASDAALAHRLESVAEQERALEQRRAVLEELRDADVKRRDKIRQALARLGVHEPRFLDDVIEVPAGWEDSLDLYLDQLRDAVLVPTDEDPLALARALAADRSQGTLLRPGDPERTASGVPETGLADAGGGAGRSPRNLGGGLSPRPFDPYSSATGSWSGPERHGGDDVGLGRLAIKDAGDDPAVVSSLGEAMGLPAEFACSLPPAYLVESAEDAERLALDRPGTAFISRDRLWAHNGVLHVQGDEALPGVLARNRELQEIADQLPGILERREDLVAERRELTEARERLVAELERAEAELAEINKTQAVAAARQQDAAARRDKAQQHYQKLALRQQQLASELEQHSERRSALQRQLETAQSAHRNMETLFDGVQAEVDQRRQEREAVRTTGAGHQGRLELLHERVESHATEKARLSRQIEDVETYLEHWSAEERRLAQRRTDLEGQVATAEAELQEALEQRAEAEDLTLEAQHQLDAQRQRVRELEDSVTARRDNRDGGRGALEELRVARASLGQSAEHLLETFRGEFERDLETVLSERRAEQAAGASGHADSAKPAAEPPMPLEELEEELRQRKEVLERMGPVNVLAAEEYEEQLERHGFLTEQRADVQNSILSLRSTIKEINETSSTRFLEIFEVVNKAFGESFVHLFRGGEGEMRLLDEDDPLETGIEIVARPPGKKLQNIMLMSGGEKALTAIALLFALFQTKPSPFCILDEVDAPLDDANVLRFVDTLKSMSADTQFLVVTHNKLTMEAASTLYGVTMEEKGVSKLVGVNVDELHPENALQTA